MTNDVFITLILLVASIIGIKTRFRTISMVMLGILGPLIFFTVVLNIQTIFSPFTPQMHGTVIDAETKKPLAGVNIKAGWLEKSASVGGSYSSYYKLFTTKTDANGKFVLPREMKSLNKWYFIGTSNFAGVNVTIYPQDYDYKVQRINYKKENKITIVLEQVKTDKEFLDNILNYYHMLFLMHEGVGSNISDPNEKMWLKNAYYQFENRYSNSKADQDYLYDISNMLQAIKEPDCIHILEKILIKYKNNKSLVWYAKNNINALKQIYNYK